MPLLALLALLMPLAAVGLTLRRRALAGGGSTRPLVDGPAAPFVYKPAIDPLAVPPAGLGGAGAPDLARLVALSALETHASPILVVVPRPDATLLFGLGDDELLDETALPVFLPGDLDAALAYLETELSLRGQTPGGKKLLLVADCVGEAARINELLAGHSQHLSAVLLGDWPYDRAVIDENGLVTAPPTLAAGLPERVPALSRGEARERLLALTGRHRPARPSRRRQ